MATTRRKLIGTATLSFGGTAVAYGVTSIPTGVSPEAEVDDAAAFGDTVTTHVARNLATLNQLEVELIDEGQARTGLVVGATGDVEISLTFRNGVDTDTELATAVDEKCTIVHIDHGAVEVQGERVATITLTLQPVGGEDRSDVSFAAVAGG